MKSRTTKKARERTMVDGMRRRRLVRVRRKIQRLRTAMATTATTTSRSSLHRKNIGQVSDRYLASSIDIS